MLDDTDNQHNSSIESQRLSDLSKAAAALGFDIVEIAGFLDDMDSYSGTQVETLGNARDGAQKVLVANDAVIGAVKTLSTSADKVLAEVEASVEMFQRSGERTQSVASWVQALDNKMNDVTDTLKSVESNNGNIASIASQVNILAINAKIEAARAGTAGRGFAVVAEAINELSHKTGSAAEAILQSITTLSTWIETLRNEAADVSQQASSVLEDSKNTDSALASIADQIRITHDGTEQISMQARAVQQAGAEFEPCFESMTSVVSQTTTGIHEARRRVNGLIDRSEQIVQNSVALGGATDDQRFIDAVQEIGSEISETFETGVANQLITLEELFDGELVPIAGTNPVQMMAKCTRFTDRVLPPIQERAFGLDPKVVFCASITKSGYLPTHNRKFSQPQKPGDVAWNTANSRNRRVFDDRVGLKAGRNTDSFLLQVYRRDMGGGQFRMMKDLSAPIVVNGRHWGGVRLAYTF